MFMEYGGTAELEHYRPRMVDGGHFHFCMMVDNVNAAVEACLAYDPEISTLSPHLSLWTAALTRETQLFWSFCRTA
jgi:hypothetical protein